MISEDSPLLGCAMLLVILGGMVMWLIKVPWRLLLTLLGRKVYW